VRVPFGRREVVGLVLHVGQHSDWPLARLKPVSTVLDAEPVIPADLLSFILWAADYYHHPVGEVVQSTLPVLLRRGQAPESEAGVAVWQLTDTGRQQTPESLKRAVARRRLLEALRAAPQGLDAEQLAAVTPAWRAPLGAMQKKGWLSMRRRDCLLPAEGRDDTLPQLNPAQQSAVAAIHACLGGYQGLLLHGITGSGKTEVYLHAIDQVRAEGGQALVLVPEIGLTPQLLERFQRRFPVIIAVLHSGMNDSERLCAWGMARSGKAAIVIGTRSAVFTPMPALRLIVVDEEHDGSYKQQDGFRYSARDLAVVRARREGVPVVLGSATPSLESLNNARQGRYRELALPDRTGSAVLPRIGLLDLRKLSLHDGLSPPLVDALRERLARKEQSLIFINRRGFAPVWMCHDCGWLAPCPRCDARMTLHKRHQRLRCHHCGSEAAVPQTCPACASGNLHGLGEGTERVEEALQKMFPAARIERVDRDSTRRKGALADKLRRIHAGEADILVGTQMLAKGHDFPNLTLVGVLNVDQGLYGVDFRSGEQLFQRIAQVAGRAGRADKPGEVLIQSYHPDNPVFSALQQHDYPGYARYVLEERQQAQFPPFAHFALLRAESPNAGIALGFVQLARRLGQASPADGRIVLGEPVASPMEKRAGRYRAQLLVQSAQRGVLHEFLSRWLVLLEDVPEGRKVRWSLDVDPLDMY
jgi:primosomal protein N' (replication factor Y)